MSSERVLRAIAIALALLLFAYQASAAFILYEHIRWPETFAHAGFDIGSPWPTVTRVSSTKATEAGLAAGQRITAVQGRPFQGRNTLREAIDKLFPGDRFRVSVEGRDAEISWQLDGESPAPPAMLAFVAFLNVFMPVLCLVTGCWTVIAKPRDPQAWLLFLMLAAFSHMPSLFAEVPTQFGAWRTIFLLLHKALNAAWPLSMFAFAWHFPRQAPAQRLLRWPFRAYVAILLAAIVMAVLRDYRELTEGPKAAAFIATVENIFRWLAFVMMAAVSCFFALLSYKLFVLHDADSRRRMQTILWGIGVALSPLFLIIVFSIATRRDMSTIPAYVTIPAMLALILFPITLAYVIIVHRAFGLSMVIRQGLRYALARRGVRLMQILLSIAVMVTTATLATTPGINRPRVIIVMSAGVALVLLLRRIAEVVSAWVDRRFFREAYNAEQLLAVLSEDVRTIVETRPLLETVANKITAALHVDKIAMMLADGPRFQPAFALGGQTTAIDAGSRIAATLQRERTPLRVYFDDTGSWLHRENIGPAERAWLEGTSAQLLLALAVKERLLGFVVLGPKRSEEPYTPNDVKLLQTVAAQTGLALENSQLTAAVADAIAQRERLNREIEIAQEVQERLFPQNLPEVPGIEYHGYCRPARGVGGDSYDFLSLEGNRFALSIGDVSGKGIPASLLMASLQSALRGQAMSAPQDLGAMMSTLNKLIYDSSPSNRYATLFYAEYHRDTRELVYANGGHNAPMILRGEELVRLDATGPVVGLFRPGVYSEARITIEEGDLLVGFTDGVSEAMNAQDDEWGEDALAEFLKSIKHESVKEMTPKILAAADAFANGHPQHDDMTLILIRFASR